MNTCLEFHLVKINKTLFTIFLFVSSATLICIAHYPNFFIAASPIIGVSLSGAALFIVLGFIRHGALLRMPGAYLVGSTALFVALGL